MQHTVRVRFYAQLREALKTSEENLTLSFPATENQILITLFEKHPKQKALLLASRIAVDENYLEVDAILEAASIIDVISPISGG